MLSLLILCYVELNWYNIQNFQTGKHFRCFILFNLSSEIIWETDFPERTSEHLKEPSGHGLSVRHAESRNTIHKNYKNMHE